VPPTIRPTAQPTKTPPVVVAVSLALQTTASTATLSDQEKLKASFATTLKLDAASLQNFQVTVVAARRLDASPEAKSAKAAQAVKAAQAAGSSSSLRRLGSYVWQVSFTVVTPTTTSSASAQAVEADVISAISSPALVTNVQANLNVAVVVSSVSTTIIDTPKPTAMPVSKPTPRPTAMPLRITVAASGGAASASAFGGLSTGAIGGIIGGFFGLIILIFVVVCARSHYRKQAAGGSQHPDLHEGPEHAQPRMVRKLTEPGDTRRASDFNLMPTASSNLPKNYANPLRLFEEDNDGGRGKPVGKGAPSRDSFKRFTSDL